MQEKEHAFQGHILSVNVGRSTQLTVGGKTRSTGIHKEPVAGPVQVSRLGLAEDVIANTKHHGGPDQAVYLYSAEDYDWWRGQLKRPLAPGTFGENITIDRWQPGVRIGDRLVMPTVTLEITAPRIPCATLAARMGIPAFVKQFAQARRPGLYARVLSEGAICRGEPFAIQPAPPEYPEALAIFDVWYEKERNPDLLRAGLNAPIAARAAAAFRYWLQDAAE